MMECNSFIRPDVCWKPEWLVDVGHDCQVGIAIDDGCYIVLCPNDVGQWLPTKHIPIAAAKFLGGLASNS